MNSGLIGYHFRMKLTEQALTLGNLQPGESGWIQGYTQSKETHHRLQELGLVPGTFVEVLRFAPLGDPMELKLRNYNLSLRHEDAMSILIKKKEKE